MAKRIVAAVPVAAVSGGVLWHLTLEDGGRSGGHRERDLSSADMSTSGA